MFRFRRILSTLVALLIVAASSVVFAGEASAQAEAVPVAAAGKAAAGAGLAVVPESAAGTVVYGPWAGSAGASGASGFTGACVASTVCLVAAPAAVAAAGFALGYFGLGHGLCAVGGNAAFPGFGDVCGELDYAGDTSANPEGWVSEAWEQTPDGGGCIDSLGFQRATWIDKPDSCKLVSWDSIADFGGDPTAYFAIIRDSAGVAYRFGSTSGGCLGHYDSVSDSYVVSAGSAPANCLAYKSSGGTQYGGLSSVSAGGAPGWVKFSRPRCVTTHPTLCGVWPGSKVEVRRFSDGQMVVGGLQADAEADALGLRVQTRAVATCLSSTGVSTTRTATSGVYFQKAGIPAMQSPCLGGEIAIQVKVDHRLGNSSSYSWQNDVTWTAPASWADPDWDFRPCLRSTDRFCAVEPELDPATGERTGTKWGGVPLTVPDATPGRLAVFEPDARGVPLNNGELAETHPAKKPDPDPGVDPNPGGEPDYSIPPSGPGGSPPAPPAGGGRWTTCLDDQGAEWGGVTMNPVTWVRAILQWVWAPIYCALWWFFVPGDGFGGLWDDFRELWEESDILQPIRGFMAGIGDGAGAACLPVNIGPLGGNASVDVLQCNNIAIQWVWNVVIGLGFLGVLWQIGNSLSDLSDARRRR